MTVCRTAGAVTTTWSRVSGPGTVTFGDAGAVDTSGDVLGGGDVRVAALGDRRCATVSDDVTVEVSAASPGNQPPSVEAGTVAPVQLPGSASLDGTVCDDGLPDPPVR